jgi:hypothetical protein
MTLINNAGVMNQPKLTTADGFELQFGTGGMETPVAARSPYTTLANP